MKTFLLMALITSFATTPAFSKTKWRYEVPVDESLKPYASYILEYKRDRNDDLSEISFSLPDVLVGEEKTFELKRSAPDSDEWTGENAQAECHPVGREMTCMIQFQNLNIDLNKVAAAIDREYDKAHERAGKLAVARHFSGEPIGIVSFRLKRH